MAELNVFPVREDEQMLEYTNELCPGVDQYYICRHCRFFAPNTMWVVSSSGTHFRCAACGEQYKALTQRNTLLKAQKILVIQRDLAKEPSFYLCQWEDTDFHELEGKVVNKNCHRTYFTQYEWTPERKANIDWVNQGTASGKSWKYDHLEKGFVGAYFNPKTAEEEYVRSKDDIIEIIRSFEQSGSA